MPLQASNWRALFEGVSDTLDLPMAVKGFIFVCDFMFAELQPKVYFECLIAGVILFLNRHRGSQAEMTATYPLVVPLGPSLRPDTPPLEAITRAFTDFWSAPIPAASLMPALPHTVATAPPPAMAAGAVSTGQPALPSSNDLSTALAQLQARGGLLPPGAPAPAVSAAAAAFQRAAGGAGFVPPVNAAPLPFATAAAVASSPPALPNSSAIAYVGAPALLMPLFGPYDLILLHSPPPTHTHTATAPPGRRLARPPRLHPPSPTLRPSPSPAAATLP